MHFILYKTTNIINNKIYIGIHKSNNENDGYLGSGFLLKKAIRKYGRHSFTREILFSFNTLDEAVLKEKEIVNEEFLARTDVYNISIGGGIGGRDINGLSFKGRRHTNSSIEKIREFRKGKSFITPEGRDRLATACKNDQNRKDKISRKLSGRKLSEDTKAKISESLKNRDKSKIPKGYKRKNKQIWITNGLKNTRIPINSPIPEDWYKGRVNYSRVC